MLLALAVGAASALAVVVLRPSAPPPQETAALASVASAEPILPTEVAPPAEPGAQAPSQPSPAPVASSAPVTSPACVPGDLAARAGQVLVVGLPNVTDPADPLVAELADLRVGGVLLTKTNVASRDQVATLVAALKGTQSLTPVVTIDEEPGRVSSIGDLTGRTSSARTLAARGGTEEVRDVARSMGVDLAELGIDLDLAPVADLDAGPAGGIIGDRSFSADPLTAAAYTVAFSRGLAEAGVVPTVKHFPGHGRSPTDSHERLATVDVSTEVLAETDLAPFQAAIDAGAPVVMLDHVGYTSLDPDLPASLSPRAYELLRSMGFNGVAMTDSVGMGAVNLTWPFPEAAVRAVEAGADAVLATDGNQARAMRDALVAAVTSGRLAEARLDEAAARMLDLKGEDPAKLTCASADVPPLERLAASAAEGNGGPAADGDAAPLQDAP